MNILFVCTGNICRSPTAEAVFRQMAADAGLGGALGVESAGTHGYHVGEPPDPRTAAAARARGYDMDGQTARRVSMADFEQFDLLLAMDQGHHAILSDAAPTGAREKVRLFLDYAPEAGMRDVPDPYYGGPDGFDLTLDLVEAGCRGLLDAVRGELAAR